MKNILSTLSVLLDIRNLELLYLKHRMHSPLEDPDRKSNSISNRTDAFMIYYSCINNNKNKNKNRKCDLAHV
ncbi:MAG: hypothetical protein WCB31_01390 [Nitrososphaeraceae archaeon]